MMEAIDSALICASPSLLPKTSPSKKLPSPSMRSMSPASVPQTEGQQMGSPRIRKGLRKSSSKRLPRSGSHKAALKKKSRSRSGRRDSKHKKGSKKSFVGKKKSGSGKKSQRKTHSKRSSKA